MANNGVSACDMDPASIQISITPGLYNFEAQNEASSKKWERPRVDQILANVPLWNRIFVISCVIAVSLDPLFFYIPIIDEENKCLGIDKKLKVISILLRFLTDITFIVHIIYQIREAIKLVNSKVETTMLGWESKAKAVARKLSWRSIVTDFLAVLPIPQVLLVGVFFDMRGRSGYLDNRKILSLFLLAQYIPRIYIIHLSSKKLTQTGIWAKGAFNFFLYILASHVLGAFWYFFSVQRETSCWYRACLKHGVECMSSFYCDDQSTIPRNTTFLDEFCPINVPSNDTPPFDFGIFLDCVRSGNTASSTNFPMKFFYSFWWGLRNLSNFGTNLTTSTYVWENCFAILISVIGLLLFLYLIGNVQTFMQLATTKSEEIRQKIKMKEKDIEKWMEKNGLLEDMKSEIRKNIKQKLEENINADLENIFSILPDYTQKALKRFLCMSIVKQVPMLKNMDERVLKMICDYLKPVIYAEHSVVVQIGDPLDRMLFITEGEGFIYTYTPIDHSHGGSRARTSSPSTSTGSGSPHMCTNSLKKGDFYGEELLKFASSPPQLPISTETVQCHTKVEAFVLMARDLRSVVSKCEVWWTPNNYITNRAPATTRGGGRGESSAPKITYVRPVHPQ